MIVAVWASTLELVALFARKYVEMERNSFLVVMMEMQMMAMDAAANVKFSKATFVTEDLLIQKILAVKVSQLL